MTLKELLVMGVQVQRLIFSDLRSQPSLAESRSTRLKLIIGIVSLAITTESNDHVTEALLRQFAIPGKERTGHY